MKLLKESEANDQLKELFEQCKIDGLFASYSINLVSTHPIEEASASYLAHYQLSVKKEEIGEEVRRRVMIFIREEDCEWGYLGHSNIIKEMGISILSLSAMITPSQEPI